MANTLDQQDQLSKNWQKSLQQGITNKREFRRNQESLSNVPLEDTIGFRGAGWQDSTNQKPIQGDSELFNALSGKFGYYKENNQEHYGYYGKDNVYDQGVQERLLGEKGYTKDISGLNDLYKQHGYRLPELNGTTYANAAQRSVEQQLKQQQQVGSGIDSPYYRNGFIPGQNVDMGDGSFYRWDAGAPQYTSFLSNKSLIDPTREQAYVDQLSEYNMGLRTEAPVARSLTQDEQVANDFTNYFKDTYPEGSGKWFYNKGGKEYANTALEYSPTFGYKEQTYDSAPKGFAKYMPALTMGVLGAMTGGAASMMGAPAAAAGAAAAIPSTMNTGLNTGDWGKAIGGMGIGAITGGLTPSLSSIFGGGQVGQGIARAITGAAGGGLQSLLSGSNPMKGIATGAISGGLGSALSSLGLNMGMDKLTSNTLSNTITNVAKKKLKR